MLTVVLSLIPLAFAFFVIMGALTDLGSFRIPNWVSYGLVLLFALQSIAYWLHGPQEKLGPAPSLAINIGIALVVLFISIIFWRRGLIGGGDAKYLAATSLWMGPVGVIEFMVILSVLALVMALALKLTARWGFLVHAAGLPAFVKRLYAKLEVNQLPYGFPIGIAALIMIPEIFGQWG